MQRFILLRMIQMVVALFVISIIVFGLIRMTGSPVDALLPDEAEQEDIERAEKYWGIDQPLPVQYITWIKRLFTGSFGQSYKWQGTSTKELIVDRFPATLQLAGAAVVIAAALALPIGVFSAVKRDTFLDYGGKIIALLGQSLPSFWLGIVMIWIFAVMLGWLPTSGRGGVDHIILPAIALGAYQVAALMRLVRSSMLDVLDSEYVKLARIKGLPEWKVIWKHCLRNAAIAPLTYFAFIGAAMLTGSVITETVFAWPGLGLLAIEAVRAKDYEVIQTLIMLFAAFYISCNLFADILYAYLDPRIRYG